jgi:hypothetical protein
MVDLKSFFAEIFDGFLVVFEDMILEPVHQVIYHGLACVLDIHLVISLELDHSLDKGGVEFLVLIDAGKMVVLEIDLFLDQKMFGVMYQAEEYFGGRILAYTILNDILKVTYDIQEILVLPVYETDAGIVFLFPGIITNHDVKIEPVMPPANDIYHKGSKPDL